MLQQLCGSKHVFCINSQPYQALHALEAHKSQYVWYDDEITAQMRAYVQHLHNGYFACRYRQWFIRISCFTYVNTLFKLEP